MSKLTKKETSVHNQALDLLNKDKLTFTDRRFVLDNYHESATNMNGIAGAFFTPKSTARDFSLEVRTGGAIVDLCAGIGSLVFDLVVQADYEQQDIDITCIELNRDYYDIGRKLFPEANWILGDITDFKLWSKLGFDPLNKRFDQAISNPPFGNIKTTIDTMPISYEGGQFEFKAVEISCIVANCATFIMPQGSTPFLTSGYKSEPDGHHAKKGRSVKYDKFSFTTGIELSYNIGIEVSTKGWKGVSPVCEIVKWEGVYADDYQPKNLFE
ncbi:MAG: hypothetical protein JKY96_00140 [Phycisphaerales bacterium]|nr:hypothetical protein [Phycisphaerales bacterium]